MNTPRREPNETPEPGEPPEERSTNDPDTSSSRRRRPDPEAPGNFVDDQEVEDIPEPNEPA